MGTPLAKLGDRYIETTVDDEVVVMDLESGSFFSLSGTALAIWTAIDGSRDRDGLVDALCAEYDAGPDTVSGDVDAFLADLQQAGLVSGG